MIANILAADAPFNPGGRDQKVKIQFLPELVTLHITLKRTTHAKNGGNILPAHPPPPNTHDTRDGVKRSKFNFCRIWSCCLSN